MSKYQPNVGDLVCYNAAGMRKHSLGLVVEKRREVIDSRKPFDKASFVYIQWIEKPTTPPRSEFRYELLNFEGWRDFTGEEVAAWYRDRGCFEVIENK